MASALDIAMAKDHLLKLIAEFKGNLAPRKESCERDSLFYLFLEDLSKFVQVQRYLVLLREQDSALHKLVSSQGNLKKF